MRPTYPIAEEFHSIQGEGVWIGTPMKFIRLAGCNVGREVPGIPKPYHLCHSAAGTPFTCDTDYDKHYEQTVADLLEDVWEEHICLTGGEPMLHDLYPLMEAAVPNLIHIETSGTVFKHYPNTFWLTVSPKQGCLKEMLLAADEIKFIVNNTRDELAEIEKMAAHTAAQIFVQPANLQDKMYLPNVEYCLSILKKHPDWRLSPQLHKLLHMR
jgi:7-carboxy-7-deazaguanine synthase